MSMGPDHTTEATFSEPEPETVVSAKYVHPQFLRIAFQDGQDWGISIDWAVGDESVVDRLLLETVRPSEDGSAIEIDLKDGGTFELDALAVRALGDPELRKQLEQDRDQTRAKVGEKIRAVRTAAGITTGDASNGAGITAFELDEIEAGKRTTTGKTLIALAKAFGVKLDKLLPISG